MRCQGRMTWRCVATLVAALGNGTPAKGLGDLFTRAATLQPDVTGELLDVVESALAINA